MLGIGDIVIITGIIVLLIAFVLEKSNKNVKAFRMFNHKKPKEFISFKIQ